MRRKGGKVIATASITKQFAIKDKATCEKLITILNESKPQKPKFTPNKYEEGKKLLTQYYSH